MCILSGQLLLIYISFNFQGKNGTFKLFLKGDKGVFEITPTTVINEATFLIKVKNSTYLDYEQVKHVNFTIVARETAANPKQSEVGVKINIIDRNDNYPEFVRNTYEVFVPENCKIGTTVAWVQALDDDSGEMGTKGVRYTNLSGSVAES